MSANQGTGHLWQGAGPGLTLIPSHSCISDPTGISSEWELSVFRGRSRRLEIILVQNAVFGGLNSSGITEEGTGDTLDLWDGTVPYSRTVPDTACPQMSASCRKM